MPVIETTPRDAAALIAAGARLIDVRGPDEHARERIAGAANLPLDALCAGAPLPAGHGPVVFHCKGGMRTRAQAARLAEAAGDAPCHVLAGGIEGWRAAGLPTQVDRGQPLEIMRQVQLAAGGLVVAGVLGGWLLHPALFALAGFVGAGLMLAGATGFCGMARLLERMPWNRRLA